MKAILIGLDGGDWHILNNLISEGLMPNLKELVSRGFASDLISTVPPSTPQAWATILTGLNAGRHGVFGFANLTSNTERKLNSLKNMAGKKLWHYLNEANLSCGIVNVPMTYPPEPLNGFMVSGFMTPENAPVFTYPQSLGTELKQRFSYSLDLESPVGQSASVAFIERLNKLNQTHFNAAVWLAKKYQPDVMFFVSVLPDRLQHLYINYLHTPEALKGKSAFQISLKNAYRLLDQQLGELIAALGPKRIFIVSDHGFCLEEGLFLVNDWLLKNKFLFVDNMKVTARMKKYLDYQLYKLDLSNNFFKQQAAAFLNNRFIKRFTKRAFQEQTKWGLNIINWEQTKAFASPVYQQGIYINKLIKDNKTYEEIRNELLTKLILYFKKRRQTVNLWKKEEIYHGPFLWAIPDILVSLNNFKISCKDNIFFSQDLILKPTGKGIHSLTGIFIAHGANLAKQQYINKLSVTDVLPTFLHSLGLNNFHGLDGTAYNLFELPQNKSYV